MKNETLNKGVKQCKICGATLSEDKCPNEVNHKNIINPPDMNPNTKKDMEETVNVAIAAHEAKYHKADKTKNDTDEDTGKTGKKEGTKESKK